MNPTTPYEQLIAAKLDQVPVPDMADSIWASIDVQLDAPADVPNAQDASGTPDAPDSPAQGPASTFNGIGWYGLAALVTVVAIVLWWYHRSPEKHERLPVAPPAVTPRPVAPPPAEPPPSGADSNTSGRPARKKPIPTIPGAPKKDTVLFHAPPHDSIRVDSAARQILPPVKIDSSSLQKNRAPLPDVDLYSSPPSNHSALPPPPSPASTGKKHKGVKGITSDDYKISAGKDSGRKKN